MMMAKSQMPLVTTSPVSASSDTSVKPSLQYPAIMGVLNVTPDSFSDGGRYMDPDRAVERACCMLDEGADIIDIGGESTRPGATPLSPQAELDRVIPVITQLRQHRKDSFISIDTSKPEVMREAIRAGANMINDVNALAAPGALDAVVDAPVYVCLMHKQGQPATMQLEPHYADVKASVLDALKHRVAVCESAGINRDRLIIDPGFGFGKTTQHNLQLLHSLHQLTALSLPILIGWSRKSSIGDIIHQPVDKRLYGSLAAAVIGFLKGASLFRTHDVKPTKEAILVAEAVLKERVL